MVNGLYNLGELGRDDELRAVLQQQQDKLKQLEAGEDAAEAGFRLTKHDTLRIAIGVMLLLFLFK